MVRSSGADSSRDSANRPSKRLKSSSRSDGDGAPQNPAKRSSLVSPAHQASPFLASIHDTSPPPMPSSLPCSSQVFLDLRTLDCSICMDVLSAPIFQCSNGHYACRYCSECPLDKCPSCTEPVGKIRNLGLEKVLESMKVFCKFSANGCPRGLIPYELKKTHEQKCMFSPHDCPLRDCAFNGPLAHFRVHFKDCHKVKTLSFHYNVCFTLALCLDNSYVLLHDGDNTFFLFQALDQGFGKLVYVSSLLPLCIDQMFPYQLDAEFNQGHPTLASNIRTHGCSEVNLEKMEFLLVPRCYFKNEKFQVEVTIKHYVFQKVDTSSHWL